MSFFTLLTPLKTLKSKVWKIKKFAQDMIILHICTKTHNHMMYGSWDTKWDRQNFLSFWAIFCSFTTPHTTNDPEDLNFEKRMKKMPGDVIFLSDVWSLKYKV